MSIYDKEGNGMYSEKIIVGKGTECPLDGLLTLPDGTKGPVPAVVMVSPLETTSAVCPAGRAPVSVPFSAFRGFPL